MEEQYIERLFKIRELDGLEYLLYVSQVIAKELGHDNISLSSNIEDVYIIKLANYSAIVNNRDIEHLKKEQDPFALDRYILGCFIKNGFKIKVEDNKYLEIVFSVIVKKETKIKDRNLYTGLN